MHWRPGYLVPSVWGSTSGLPTEEERRALLSIAVAIPGYLLSGSSGHTSEPCVPSTAIAPLLFSPPLLLRQWLFLCTPFGSAFLSAAALASFIGLYLHLLQGHSSQHHRLVFEIFFISVVIGICGAGHSIPAALPVASLATSYVVRLGRSISATAWTARRALCSRGLTPRAFAGFMRVPMTLRGSPHSFCFLLQALLPNVFFDADLGWLILLGLLWVCFHGAVLQPISAGQGRERRQGCGLSFR